MSKKKKIAGTALQAGGAGAALYGLYNAGKYADDIANYLKHVAAERMIVYSSTPGKWMYERYRKALGAGHVREARRLEEILKRYKSRGPSGYFGLLGSVFKRKGEGFTGADDRIESIFEKGKKLQARILRSHIEKYKDRLREFDAKGRIGIPLGVGLASLMLGGAIKGEGSLEKTSSEVGDDERRKKRVSDKIVSAETNAKAAILPLAAFGAYGLGKGYELAGDVANRRTVFSDERLKELMEKEREIIESFEESGEKEMPKAMEAELEAIRKKKFSHIRNLAESPSEILKGEGSKIKWMSFPLGIAGAYMAGKRMVSDEPLVRDPDVSRKIDRYSNAAIMAGAPIAYIGLKRPVIDPLVKMYSKGDVSGLENKHEVKIPKKVGTSKDVVNAIEEAGKKFKSAGKFVVDNPFKRDLRIAALGYGLIGSGLIGKAMSSSGETADALAEQTLEKKSSAGEVIAGGGAGHVLQNLMLKGRIHSGRIARDMVQGLMEGNRGYAEKSRLSMLGDGFISGTLNPDAKVVSKEMRHLGKKLKEKGIDLDKLSPEDKVALKYLQKGDVRSFMRMIPRSELARFVSVAGVNDQTNITSLFGDTLVDNITKKDWKEIEDAFSKSNIAHFVEAVKGEIPSAPYTPPKHQLGLTGIYNKAYAAIRGNKAANSVYRFLNMDVDEALKLKKKRVDLDRLDKEEKKGYLAGVAASLAAEPGVGVWNAVKPKLAETPGVDTATNMALSREYALGLLGLKPSSKKADVAIDQSAEYLLSPTLNYMYGLSRHMGETNRKILQKGLPKERFEKLLDSRDIKELAHSPMAKTRNSEIEAVKRLHGAGRLDEALETTDMYMSDATEKAAKAASKDLKYRKIDPSNILSAISKEEIRKAKRDLGGKVGDEIMSRDFNTRKSTSESVSKANDEITRLALPGITLGTLAAISPVAMADYRRYKEKRNGKAGK